MKDYTQRSLLFPGFHSFSDFKPGFFRHNSQPIVKWKIFSESAGKTAFYGTNNNLIGWENFKKLN